MSSMDVILPREQQEGTQSVVARWLKGVGEQVRLHEPLIEINTDKVSVEIAAPANGILREIVKQESDAVQPGEVLGRIELVSDDTHGEFSKSNSLASQQSLQEPSHEAPQELSPAVRKLLQQHGLHASQIAGSGRGGRITTQDVESYLASHQSTPSSALPGKKVPHTVMRRNIAQHMTHSVHTAPHVTSVFEVDFSTVLHDRKGRKEEFEKRGVNLTLTSYIVQVTVSALQAVPEVNSRFHAEHLEIFDDLNIGIATALSDDSSKEVGLIVPVIQRAQTLDLFQIAQKLQELTTRARAGQLSPAEVQNGTFTISNHGVSGSLLATPIIINQPQSAILGIGKLEKRPVVQETNGQEAVVIRSVAYVSLTLDHRVLDGFKANQVLRTFKECLEQFK